MDVFNLIRSVKCRVPIWNRQHPQYKDRDCSLALWKEVAHENGIDVDTARCKWRGLRDSYRIQLRKLINTEKNGTSQPLTWEYFDDMAFVKDQIYIDVNRRKYCPDVSFDEFVYSQRETSNGDADGEDSKGDVFCGRSRKGICDSRNADTSSLVQAKVNFPIQNAIEHAIRLKMEQPTQIEQNGQQLPLPVVRNTNQVGNNISNAYVIVGKLAEKLLNGSTVHVGEEDGSEMCIPADFCTTEVTEDTETRLEFDSMTKDGTDSNRSSDDESNVGRPLTNVVHLQKKLKALQDDNYCFLMSILPQMKTLPAKRKLYARIKIQELLLAEVSNMEKQNVL